VADASPPGQLILNPSHKIVADTTRDAVGIRFGVVWFGVLAARSWPPVSLSLAAISCQSSPLVVSGQNPAPTGITPAYTAPQGIGGFHAGIAPLMLVGSVHRRFLSSLEGDRGWSAVVVDRCLSRLRQRQHSTGCQHAGAERNLVAVGDRPQIFV